MFYAEKFRQEIETQGYSIVRNALPPDFIEKAKAELKAAIDQEAKWHGASGYTDYAMVLLCSLYDRIFIDLFDLPLVHRPFEAVLGDGCTVYAYTSSSMPPKGSNYSNRVHVDCPRVIPGYITNMGATILLDDFIEENGATWFLPYSQTLTELPSEEEFYAKAKRLIEKAGTIWFFNARIVHAGGVNNTSNWRHALTINMGRPWMKQRIDIPRAMAHMNLNGVSDKALQKLGFHAQTPANYNEYYQPPHLRKFKQKTE